MADFGCPPVLRRSASRQASKHARKAGHPVIASAERGQRWLYGYPGEAYAEY